MSGKKKNNNEKKRDGELKAVLKPPYHWRCRICSQEGEGEELSRHCGQIVRQLAPVSMENKQWFNDFLTDLSWKFVDSRNFIKLTGALKEPELLAMASEAGQELEKCLNQLEVTVPTQFELYDSRSDHVRISDLKKSKRKKSKKLKNGRWITSSGFDESVKSAIDWHGKSPPPLHVTPHKNVELGHVFDEYLTQAIQSIVSELWSPGKRVELYCEELNVSVTGTPDLMYSDIPVETKTTQELPSSNMKKSARTGFQSKWNTNYLPQISMYSKACNRDWMFLLLISRISGQFSIVPVSGNSKYTELQNKWKIWSQDVAYMEMIGEYRQLRAHA